MSDREIELKAECDRLHPFFTAAACAIADRVVGSIPVSDELKANYVSNRARFEATQDELVRLIHGRYQS